jgi:hypothetical protein
MEGVTGVSNHACNSINLSEFGTIDHDLHRARRAPVARFFSRGNVAKLEGETKEHVQMLSTPSLQRTVQSHISPRLWAEVPAPVTTTPFVPGRVRSLPMGVMLAGGHAKETSGLILSRPEQVQGVWPARLDLACWVILPRTIAACSQESRRKC